MEMDDTNDDSDTMCLPMGDDEENKQKQHDEEFLQLIENSNTQELSKVNFLFGEQPNSKNEADKNVFRLDRIIESDETKKTAFRILVEDSKEGINLAKKALDNAEKNVVVSLDKDIKKLLIKDVAQWMFPDEICYLDWKCCRSTSKFEDDILEHAVIKELIENSFDIELWEKIQSSKKTGQKELQKFLLENGACLGQIVYLKYEHHNVEEKHTLNRRKSVNDRGMITKYGKTLREGRTLFRILLEDVINGHKLVMVMLNHLVKAPESESTEPQCPKCLDTDEQDAFIKLDLYPLYTEEDQMQLVRDLLDIQTQRGCTDNFREIFDHPIIHTYVLTKWDMVYWNFIIRVRLFALFVFLFTAFIRIRIIEFNRGIDLKKVFGFFDSCLNSENDASRTEKTTLEKEALIADNRTWWEMIDPTIFNENKNNVWLFSIIMVGIVSWQLIGALWQVYVIFSCGCSLCEKKKGEEKKKGKEKKKHDGPLGIEHYTHRNRTNNLFIRSVNFIVLIVGISSCMYTCLLGIVLFMLWAYLVVRELLQFGVLVLLPVWKGQGTWRDFFKQMFKMNYWNDPENYIELISLACIPIALFCEITGDGTEILRGIVAAGICCAWIELIFILGMPSTSFLGDFITMFYNVLKIKLWSYMQIFFLLTTGFGFGFWILNEGHKPQIDDNLTFKKNETLSFKGFWVSQILSVTMSAGELNVNNVYTHFQSQPTTLIFAMAFLLLLIILCSIAMLNLLVAAIISDYQEMESEVDYQTMIFMAEYAIQIETYRNVLLKTPFSGIAKRLKERSKVPQNLQYCPHEMCNNKQRNFETNCKKMPLPTIRPENHKINAAGEAEKCKSVLKSLIALRNRDKQNTEDEGKHLCEYHQSKE